MRYSKFGAADLNRMSGAGSEVENPFDFTQKLGIRDQLDKKEMMIKDA